MEGLRYASKADTEHSMAAKYRRPSIDLWKTYVKYG